MVATKTGSEEKWTFQNESRAWPAFFFDRYIVRQTHGDTPCGLVPLNMEWGAPPRVGLALAFCLNAVGLPPCEGGVFAKEGQGFGLLYLKSTKTVQPMLIGVRRTLVRVQFVS